MGGYGSVPFSLEADGTVSIQALASATASGNTLTLRTTPVSIDPRDFGGVWYLDASSPKTFQGPHTLALVPALRYRLGIGGWGGLLFSVGEDGTVSTAATSAVTVSGSTLTCRTVEVISWSGTHTLKLVPRQTYQLHMQGTSASAYFTLSETCEPSPAYLEGTARASICPAIRGARHGAPQRG